ncbi:MAG: 4Fe-4S binding protein [Candidatus Moranbacteria bacterium]|jgi:NapH/MauN family ferredoxin-type protein|nr:4Fe-4S binding protein [Candidatus Moranbacteria bacterium]
MKKLLNVRTISQLAVLILVLMLTVRHMELGVEKAAPIDAFCPFGGVESFLTYVTTGEFVRRINASSFILLAIVLSMTLFFGRVFCGFFCPLGTLQEWIRALAKKLGIKNEIELSKSVDRWARYLKYVVLVVIIYFSWKVGDLVFRSYDPYNALMHLGNEFEEKPVGYSILGLVLVGSIFVKNWWCRYFCPLGAFLSIFRKISPFKIKRNNDTCVHCKACNDTCIAGLEIENQEEIKSADCVSCLRCVKDCPNGSLKLNVGKKEFSKKTFSWIVAGAFGLLIIVAVVSPLWKTKESSNIVVEETGAVDVANLRGSNTLKHVIEITGIPLDVFVEKLGIPQDIDPEMKLKDIGVKYQIKNSQGVLIETEDFRAVIEEELKK